MIVTCAFGLSGGRYGMVRLRVEGSYAEVVGPVEYRDGVNGPPPRDMSIVCKKRGEDAIRKVPCKTCGGHVQLKVFSCGLHGECCQAKTADGIRSCSRCEDFEL